jgi:citrate lyase subunit beta/citryl-CoA lyase
MTARPRRSALYIPGSNAKALVKAATLACDVVIIDLEDAVAPEAKASAREQAAAAIAGGFGDREVVLRVNGLATAWGEEDLAAAAAMAVDAVLVPKVCSAEDIAAYDRALGGATPLWTMVETARAMFRLEEIAGAPRVEALVMGTNDLAKELRARPGASRAGFVGFLSQTVAAARAFGITALDGVCNEFTDLDLFAAECAQGAALGFDGKTLIHPNQLEPCNRVFSPSDAEIEAAELVVAAFRLPENEGKGAIKVGGQMVERLHLAQSEDLLAVARAIRDRMPAMAEA